MINFATREPVPEVPGLVTFGRTRTQACVDAGRIAAEAAVAWLARP